MENLLIAQNGKTLQRSASNTKINENLLNFLPDNLTGIKKVEAKTYSVRAKNFNINKCLSVERPEFTNPLRIYGRNSIFLELAAGEAKHSLNMLKDGFQVVISDISEGAIMKVNNFAKELNINAKAKFFIIDAENLPFINNSLDGIFIIAALHHIQDVNKALAEIYRVLKPGGCFLVGYEPASWQYYVFYPIYSLLRRIIRSKNPNAPISIADDVTNGFSKRKLTKLLKKAGFQNINLTPVYYFYKTYKNYRILISKLNKEEYKESETVKKILLKIDKFIAKIPVIKNLTWDWDAAAYK